MRNALTAALTLHHVGRSPIFGITRSWRLQPAKFIRKFQRKHLHTVNVRREPYGTTTESIQVPNARLWKTPALLIPLVLGLALPALSFGGRYLIQYAFASGNDEPQQTRGGNQKTFKGTSDSNLHVEIYGRSDGPTLVFTHGWSMDSTEWYYAKRDLADRFRLVLWDLPGLGLSSQPSDRDFSLDKLAQNLHNVLPAANGKPVILVGHSIGGMINLTFCRLYPETLGREVSGIVQVDTSYTNPVKTTKNSETSQTLQKPVAEPILHAMIALSPFIHIMNWLSYQNGSLYLMNAKSSFAGMETRGQIDLISRLQAQASPAVVARGTLAMFHWDATPVLPTVKVPVLLLVGQQDTTTLPVASEHMRDALPAAKLVVIDRGAHYTLLEQNKRVNDEISRFASAHLAGGASGIQEQKP